MLPSTGYFNAINCPFYDGGLCERPFCHFRHVKKDASSSQSDGNESGAILQKLVSAAVQKVLQQSDTSTGITNNVVTTSAVEQSKGTVTYNPTPISELNKVNNEVVEDVIEQRRRHIPVPYTPRKPVSLPIKRPVENNVTSKTLLYLPPVKYIPGATESKPDPYTPIGTTEPTEKYLPGSEKELQKYTIKESKVKSKHNYVPSDKKTHRKKLMEYRPHKITPKPTAVTYQPTPKVLVPCFSSDEDEPASKKAKSSGDLNGFDDLGPEFDILDQILYEENSQSSLDIAINETKNITDKKLQVPNESERKHKSQGDAHKKLFEKQSTDKLSHKKADQNTDFDDLLKNKHDDQSEPNKSESKHSSKHIEKESSNRSKESDSSKLEVKESSNRSKESNLSKHEIKESSNRSKESNSSKHVEKESLSKSKESNSSKHVEKESLSKSKESNSSKHKQKESSTESEEKHSNKHEKKQSSSKHEEKHSSKHKQKESSSESEEKHSNKHEQSSSKHEEKKSNKHQDKQEKYDKKAKEKSKSHKTEKSTHSDDKSTGSHKENHKISSKDKHKKEKVKNGQHSDSKSSNKSSENSHKRDKVSSSNNHIKEGKGDKISDSKDHKSSKSHRDSKRKDSEKNSKKSKKKHKEEPKHNMSDDSNDSVIFDDTDLSREIIDISESDEESVAMECKRIFEEYVPPEKPEIPSDLESNDHPMNEDDTAHIPVKKRISHAVDKIVKVAPKAPLKPDHKVSAARAMAERLAKVKEYHASQNLDTTASSNTVATSKPEPIKTSVNFSHPTGSKMRIAHVPYASTLLSAKKGILAQNPKIKEPPNVTITQTVKKGSQRVAHIPNEKFIDRPGVLEPLASKIPANVRSTYLNMMIDECLKIYLSATDAYARAQYEELTTSKKCSTVQIYKNSAAITVSRLRKEFEECNGIKKSGTDCSTLQKLPGNASWSFKSKKISDNSNEFLGAKFYNNIKKWILTEEQLQENGFPRPHSSGERGRAVIYGQNKQIPPKGLIRTCRRCKKDYIVDKKGFPAIKEECVYHPNNKYRVRGEAKYQCCSQDSSSDGCCVAPCHVYEYVDFENLKGFIKTMPPEYEMEDYGVYSLDCEMCYTTHGLDLTRVTVINSECKVVYETLVKPLHPIIDYNTRYSGITEEQMADVRTTLLEVQATLLSMFNTNSILVGHSLESDFKVLKLIHDTVIDTSVLFPHKMGPPYKRALRNLSSEYLKKIIQNSVDGHDSAEDATVCMELLIYKLKEDLKTR